MNVTKEKTDSFVREMSNVLMLSPTPSIHSNSNIFLPLMPKSMTSSIHFPNTSEEEKYMDWKVVCDTKKSLPDVIKKSPGPRGRGRCTNGVNVATRFVELANGEIIDEHCAAAIRKLIQSFFNELQNHSVIPKYFPQCHPDFQNRCYIDVINAYPELGYCADNWKALKIAREVYSRWHQYHIVGKTVKAKPVPTESPPTKTSSSLGKYQITSEQSSQEDMVIKRPRLELVSESLTVQPNTTNRDTTSQVDTSKDATSKDTTSKDTTMANVTASENAKVASLKIILKRPMPNLSAPFIPPAPLAPVCKPDSQGEVSDLVSAALALTSAVGTAKIEKGTGKKKPCSEDFLKITPAITARNLCAKDWLQEHPGGLKVEFDTYFKDLSKDLQKKYASDAAIMKLDAKA
ncbi:hypothetical protein SERLADRAFT_435245 [Serpula lacrymans var. lacrymans S7.9]|uniref:Uncharacterized protein n=1 Tax=Serpula lacrymans var. lacrymans (strain S7.9) TaxID=578457 RepID=F8NMR5_SERL9|nr:uncharacterized protein SERLADRAFT_435245 [Serpula lacrymans var. lacrymans S7.9]EGO27462.1 hypothetical protein SERLADRAFT_435245 [Serpula lacrymans var. lacrymans S7.9]